MNEKCNLGQNGIRTKFHKVLILDDATKKPCHKCHKMNGMYEMSGMSVFSMVLSYCRHQRKRCTVFRHCIPGGKHSAGSFERLLRSMSTAPSASRLSGAHEHKIIGPAGVHCGHFGKERSTCLNFSANCFSIWQTTLPLRSCSG